MQIDLPSLGEQVAEGLRERRFDDTVALLREAYDSLGERKLREVLAEGEIAAWVEDLLSVAWATGLGESMYNLGAFLWNRGFEVDAVVDAYTQAAHLGAPGARGVLATNLLESGELEAASAVLDGAQPGEIDPRLVAGLRGEVRQRNGERSEEVVELLALGLESFERFRVPLVDVLVDADRYDAARQVLEANPASDDPNVWLMLGNLLADVFDSHTKAESAYRRAIALGDGYAAHNLAIDLDRRGRRDEAIELLRTAVALGDQDAQERRIEAP